MRRMVAAVPGVTRVVGAASGEEALQLCPVDAPSLVIMYVPMSGLGGVEASLRLLARLPDAIIHMATMAEDGYGVAHAVDSGPRGYLVKDV